MSDPDPGSESPTRASTSVSSSVALVDVNNFYVSSERAFDPSLEGKPLVVLSNNDGCVITRSAEAKALGIPMGPRGSRSPNKPEHGVCRSGRATTSCTGI